MPIYEYRCKSCEKTTSALILKPGEEGKVCCEHCGSDQIRKIISRFTHHKTESQRLDDFNTRGAKDDSFYRDDRNIGLWAKKRAKELGTDLGSQFDEVVEKARTAKNLDDLKS